jgi:hypothetical protein
LAKSVNVEEGNKSRKRLRKENSKKLMEVALMLLEIEMKKVKAYLTASSVEITTTTRGNREKRGLEMKAFSALLW